MIQGDRKSAKRERRGNIQRRLIGRREEEEKPKENLVVVVVAKKRVISTVTYRKCTMHTEKIGSRETRPRY